MNPNDIRDPRLDARSSSLNQQAMRRRQSREKGDFLRVWGARILTGILVVIVLLLLDGARRDAENFSLHVARVEGTVHFSRVTRGLNQDLPKQLAPREGTNLIEGDLGETAPGATATLTFPEGTALKLEGDTKLRVRLLDYERDGRRDRTLVLSGGAMALRVSPNFGRGAMRVIAGNAVVSSSGGRFRIASGTANGLPQAVVDIVSGKARVRTASGVLEGIAGQRIIANGNAVPEAVGSATISAETRGVLERMQRFDQPPAPLTNLEQSLWELPNALVRRIGFTPGGFNLMATDPARKSTCRLALTKLKTLITSQGDLPRLSPLATELGGTDEVDAQLLAFVGGCIDDYQKTPGGYVLRVRARDSQQTIFELTPRGITEHN